MTLKQLIHLYSTNPKFRHSLRQKWAQHSPLPHSPIKLPPRQPLHHPPTQKELPL